MGIVTLVSGGVDSMLMSLFAHEESVELFPLSLITGSLEYPKNGKHADDCTNSLVCQKSLIWTSQVSGKLFRAALQTLD